jgi:hypothetical protein
MSLLFSCVCPRPRPVFILDDVQVGLVPHTALFDRDFGAALTMLGDMSHDLLLVAMSSDRRFISALQRLPGVRDRLKVVGMKSVNRSIAFACCMFVSMLHIVHCIALSGRSHFWPCLTVWPYLPDNTVEKYLTHAVPALRFPAEDAALIARTVGGHMGNIVECIIDTPRYGLRSAFIVNLIFLDSFGILFLLYLYSHPLIHPLHIHCVYRRRAAHDCGARRRAVSRRVAYAAVRVGRADLRRRTAERIRGDCV